MATGEMPGTATIETKVGTLKGIPHALLGWVFVAAIAAFMTWQTTVTVSNKLDKILDVSQRQVIILEKISDRLQLQSKPQ